MSRPSGLCPQCGARIEFKFSTAVQTVCEYCKSILVRKDLNLELVGKVADLPPDPSPIQLGTEGVYGNRPFWVTGRILYRYQQGGWNEWHLEFNDGTGGWLSDAQAEYAVSFRADPGQTMPPPGEMHTNRIFDFSGERFQVVSLTEAHYAGVEGELPFEYWDKEDVLFADLTSAAGRFATVDYTEDPPLLFIGDYVDFDQLHFKNLRSFEGW